MTEFIRREGGNPDEIAKRLIERAMHNKHDEGRALDKKIKRLDTCLNHMEAALRSLDDDDDEKNIVREAFHTLDKMHCRLQSEAERIWKAHARAENAWLNLLEKHMQAHA